MAAPVFICGNDPDITYSESAYQETSFRADGQTAVRHCQLLGVNEERFIKAMLGWTEFDPDLNLLFRFPPEKHPRKPWLVARSVDFVRELGVPTFAGPGGFYVGPEVGTLQYETIEMAVSYEATPGIRWLVDGAAPDGIDHEGWRYVTYREEPDIENRIIPRNQLKFDWPGGTPADPIVPEPGVQVVPSSNVFMEWKQVSAVLDDNGIPQLPGLLRINQANCQGRVNSKTFFGAAPLTLFCTAPKKELVTMADGNPAWNFNFQLLRRGWSNYADVAHPQGDALANDTVTQGPNWTRLLTPDGTYRRVFRVVDPVDPTRAQSIYATHDLYDLFRFGGGLASLIS